MRKIIVAIIIMLLSVSLSCSREKAGNYVDRGIAQARGGNSKEAIELFTKAVQIDPKLEIAYLYRGNVYNETHKYDVAIEDYTKAIELKSNDASAYCNRAGAYALSGNSEQAIKDCTKAIELRPNYAMAYNNRAVTYERMGNAQKATEDYQQAARLGHGGAQKVLTAKGIKW
jgi:tetratricopeptide (TPR) repeat protein